MRYQLATRALSGLHGPTQTQKTTNPVDVWKDIAEASRLMPVAVANLKQLPGEWRRTNAALDGILPWTNAAIGALAGAIIIHAVLRKR